MSADISHNAEQIAFGMGRCCLMLSNAMLPVAMALTGTVIWPAAAEQPSDAGSPCTGRHRCKQSRDRDGNLKCQVPPIF